MGLQSASQPRLSYAEMAEDYPRYPDIHDLDLTLLNPRMIVVRRAIFLGRGPRKGGQRPALRGLLLISRLRLILVRAKLSTGNLSLLCRMSRHI